MIATYDRPGPAPSPLIRGPGIVDEKRAREVFASMPEQDRLLFALDPSDAVKTPTEFIAKLKAFSRGGRACWI